MPAAAPGSRLRNWVRLGSLACVIAIGVPPHPGPAVAQVSELRGLVIGIDQYPRLGERARLDGAVNDARDIADALRRAGARDLIVLLDGEASKARIAQSWQELTARSAAGDRLVFSYAGHGSQEPEPKGRNGEPDGKNENFILGGFSAEAPFNVERIVDDEMFDWLKQADDKGLRVIFIADACYSGGMYRSISTNVVKFRKVTIPEITEDQLTLPPPAFANVSPSDFRNVTFVSGSEESRVVPEVRIEGQSRGALSYAFARAIEGAADRDGDGSITQEELVSFVVPKVHSLAEGQQSPQVLPVRASREALIGAQKSAPETPSSLEIDLLKVAVVGGSSQALEGVPGVSLVADPSKADVFWDVGKGVVEHLIGGRVAEGVDERSVIPVMAKWATLKWLQTNAKGAPGQFTLKSGNQRYQPGSQIALSFQGAELPYLTLFNLAPDGRVEFFLQPYEVNRDWRGRRADWKFRPDKPPFGSEHMVAILTEEPLIEFHKSLMAMSSADGAAGLRSVVETTLSGRQFQLGLIGIYTGEGG